MTAERISLKKDEKYTNDDVFEFSFSSAAFTKDVKPSNPTEMYSYVKEKEGEVYSMSLS